MAKNPSTTLSLGGLPRVNLLPPEVGERRALQARVRTLVRLIVLAVLLVVGAYVLVAVWSTSVQAQLAAAQNQSATLLSQQGSFADAKQAHDSIDQVTEALKVTTSSEVMWADLYGVVTASLPEGARITSANFTGRAPFDGILVPASPISPSKVAIITVTVAVGSPDDAATYLQSLTSNDLVADAALTDLSGTSGQYLASFRVDFAAAALSQRFAGEATNQ